MLRWTSLPFLYSLSNLALIAAQSFNITVDDQFGPLTGDKLVRIEYSSSDDWVSGGYGVNGLRKGSPSAAGFEDTIRGTWKRSIYKPGDKSGPPTANLTFKGTAVFVQCIITNVALNNQANSDMVFKIDDGLPTTYTRAALASKPGLITTVFHQDGLSPGEHTIFIQNGRERGGPPEFNSTAIFLDAIIFTTNNRTLGIESSDASNMPTEPPLPSRAKSNTALIAAIVCSITAVVIIAVALWLFLRNRQQPAKANHLNGHP
ncbi:hypothetical protein ONZ45_g17277 [Pleurotus djamor]|nr:hypothetical protein ONZ45_g17277 [Pleurotus djamor]